MVIFFISTGSYSALDLTPVSFPSPPESHGFRSTAGSSSVKQKLGEGRTMFEPNQWPDFNVMRIMNTTALGTINKCRIIQKCKAAYRGRKHSFEMPYSAKQEVRPRNLERVLSISILGPERSIEPSCFDLRYPERQARSDHI